MHRRPFLYWIVLATAASAARAAGTAPDPALLAQLRRGGNVILMRHAATVPGIGDPDGFVLDQCGTQRNLSAAGREDAVRIGAAFKRLDVPVDQVSSSRWCRCLDTARLAFGRVSAEPMLDSQFGDDAGTGTRKAGAVRAWLRTLRVSGNIVLVTHDVNIQALAARSVRQGEMVVASIAGDGTLRVAGVWSP